METSLAFAAFPKAMVNLAVVDQSGKETVAFGLVERGAAGLALAGSGVNQAIQNTCGIGKALDTVRS
jgi:hypothetical protein